MINKYNEDYYEHGREKRVSWYNGYKFIPTRSISEAISIIERIDFQSVLDYGCAKMFLAYALYLLGKDAYGVDISEYAIENCMPKMKDRARLINSCQDIENGLQYDLIIAKDTLEHLTEEELEAALKSFYTCCEKLFIVVPLGDENLYRIPVYEDDTTHVLRKDEAWWIGKIKEAGFNLKNFSYEFGAVKENWKEHKYGNGFFVATK